MVPICYLQCQVTINNRNVACTLHSLLGAKDGIHGMTMSHFTVGALSATVV